MKKKLASSIKKDPKTFYSYANNKKTAKPKIGPIKEDDKLLTEDKDIARALNNFFTSVFTKENLINLPDVPKACENDMSDFCITKDMITLELDKLKVNKAPGGDGMHPAVLKECSVELVEPLTILFNKSLNEKVAPPPIGKMLMLFLYLKRVQKKNQEIIDLLV